MRDLPILLASDNPQMFVSNVTYQLNDLFAAPYFSTNFTKFIIDAAAIKATEIKDITKATTPFDFEGKLKRWCYKLVK